MVRNLSKSVLILITDCILIYILILISHQPQMGQSGKTNGLDMAFGLYIAQVWSKGKSKR